MHPTPACSPILARAQARRVLACAALAALAVCTSSLDAQSYQWRRLPQGDLGFTPGLVANANSGDVFTRADVGGAYRWDETKGEWRPLLDGFDMEKSQYYYVESIATDRLNPNNLYVFAGNGTGRILKSTDKGGTWAELPFTQSALGNGDWRWAGERLAVDPNNSQILYVGTRYNGLWKSTNAGASWTQVAAVPGGDSGAGVTFVVFDQGGGTASGASAILYVGVAGGGVYKSSDGGTSFAPMTGGPAVATQYPLRGVVTADGTFFVTTSDKATPTNAGSGTVHRAARTSSALVNKTPSGAADLCAITAHPTLAGSLIMGKFPGTTYWTTTNAGDTWVSRDYGSDTKADDPRGYVNNVHVWAATVQYDPLSPSRVWVADGFSVWRTDDFSTVPRTWRAKIKNYEMLISMDAVSLPSGVLMSAVADKSGFRHANLSDTPAARFDFDVVNTEPVVMTSSVDFSENNPNVIYRVGGTNTDGGYPSLNRRSADGGVTWTDFNTPKESGAYTGGNSGFGNIAVSATNPNRVVWTPTGNSSGWGGGVFYSNDGGQTWTASVGGPWFTSMNQWKSNRSGLVADRVDGNTFYIFGDLDWQNLRGKFYVSTDGGATFVEKPALDLGDWQSMSAANIKAAPGRVGEVWVSTATKLRRVTGKGAAHADIAAVTQVYNFGFGKGSAADQPAVYLVGAVNGVKGVFRSGDLGATWDKLGDTTGIGLNAALAVEGDRANASRVFIGTDGRGFLIGEAVTVAPQGTITREYWANVPGRAVSAIPVTTPPTSTSILTSFEAPTNVANNYGQRIRGFITPASSGNYTFWIAGDDDVELWISTNDTPASKVRIAYHTSSTSARQWNKFSTQKSAVIALVAGQRYYIEALGKEASGNDNLAVAWRLNNTSNPVNGSAADIIPGSVLSPYAEPAPPPPPATTNSLGTISGAAVLHPSAGGVVSVAYGAMQNGYIGVEVYRADAFVGYGSATVQAGTGTAQVTVTPTGGSTFAPGTGYWYWVTLNANGGGAALAGKANDYGVSAAY